MPTTSLRHFTRLLTPFRWATARNITTYGSRTHPKPKTANTSRIIPNSGPTGSKARLTPDFGQVRFTAQDVPPLTYWITAVGPPYVLNGEVTAAECHEVCQRYAALALEDAPGWRQRHIALPFSSSSARTGAGAGTGRAKPDDRNKIPLPTLHYVAVMLMHSRTGHIATHMLHTGVALLYPPSVLTLARTGLRRDLLDRPQFRSTREALQKLSSSSQPPPGIDVAYYRADILTVAGLAQTRLHTREADDRALKYFAAAATAASGPEPSASAWQWRVTAVLTQSQIHLQRGERERALAILRQAARELDNEQLCYRYAMQLPADDPERGTMLQRAAVSGVAEAARELGRVEEERLKDEEKGDGRGAIMSVKERRCLADEWLAIAGDKAVI
ncbi:hypothetical protein GGR54DRAFT_616052 [Hypoxylon sp. NC1633]|nr:hypothetical protein GGR54DRAFT_616052 [Hypoxylon sp. NC1633]